MTFDWNELAFGSKKPLDELKATFIAAPREMSSARVKQLIKAYLPKGNIVLGVAKEPYVMGFEDQPQFKMLQTKGVASLLDRVNASSAKHKIHVLSYFQRDAKYLVDKLTFVRVVLVRGSWQFTFHNRPEYYSLVRRGVPYEMVSPFADESEAQAYAENFATSVESGVVEAIYNTPDRTVGEMLEAGNEIARLSFDHSYQTGVMVGRRKRSGKYEFLACSFNRVVPYQTYAMHHGSSRETNFAPASDLNFYNTVHAEVRILIEAARRKLDLTGATVFINLMPCPTCARMLAETDIDGVVYSVDHSDGYAVKWFEQAGKKVERVVL